MEKPYDYREVRLWFLNDESLYNVAQAAVSGEDLWQTCNDIGLLEMFPSISQGTQLTRGNVYYSWQCIHGFE